MWCDCRAGGFLCRSSWKPGARNECARARVCVRARVSVCVHARTCLWASRGRHFWKEALKLPGTSEEGSE